MENSEDSEPPRKKIAVKPLKGIELLDQSLWLVKLPHFVADKWAHAQHDDVLGTFRVGMVTDVSSRDPTKQMIVSLESDLSSVHAPGNVETFVLKEVNNSVSTGEEEMIAFSSSQKNETFSVEGRITKSFVLRPQQSSQYRNLVRERGYQKLVQRPETHVANIKDLQRAQRQTYTIESLSSVQQDLKRKPDKRATLHDEDGYSLDMKVLKSKVIEAFERYQRLPISELLSFCLENVPGFTKEADLRDFLGQYARYNNKGEYKGTWELKENFAFHTPGSQD